MDSEFVYLVDKDIENLKERINELQRKVFNMRDIIVELAIDCNWSDDIIKRSIGASDVELEFFRGE